LTTYLETKQDSSELSTARSNSVMSQDLQFEPGVLSEELIQKKAKKTVKVPTKSGNMKKYYSALTHLSLDECNIDRIVSIVFNDDVTLTGY
jgi:hypothetical protein